MTIKFFQCGIFPYFCLKNQFIIKIYWIVDSISNRLEKIPCLRDDLHKKLTIFIFYKCLSKKESKYKYSLYLSAFICVYLRSHPHPMQLYFNLVKKLNFHHKYFSNT